jgi:hypothetical protein
LLNNPAYPNPPVPLPVLRQALDSFSALIVDAEDGGKRSISLKNKQRAAVMRMYESLGHYVEGACNNDLATFNTSGFTAKSNTRTATQPLAQAKFSSIDRGPNSGQAAVKVERQIGAIAYDVVIQITQSVQDNRRSSRAIVWISPASKRSTRQPTQGDTVKVMDRDI